MFSELWNHFTKMIGSCEQEERLNHASGPLSGLRAFPLGTHLEMGHHDAKGSQALERLCWFCL